MEVWLTRGGRLLARFWSSSKGVPRFSYEVIGLRYDKMDLPRDVSFDRPVTEKHEHWVPHCLRVEYDTFTRDYLEGDYSRSVCESTAEPEHRSAYPSPLRADSSDIPARG